MSYKKRAVIIILQGNQEKAWRQIFANKWFDEKEKKSRNKESIMKSWLINPIQSHFCL